MTLGQNAQATLLHCYHHDSSHVMEQDGIFVVSCLETQLIQHSCYALHCIVCVSYEVLHDSSKGGCLK